MTTNMILSSSLEDYLEAIFHIVKKKQAAKAKDIAKRMQVKGSSVTGALRALAEKGLINYVPYDIVTLTPKGKRIAQDVVQRHEAIRDFLVTVLAVDNDEAEDAACKMEHNISPKIYDRFIEFVKYYTTCPSAGTTWVNGKGFHCDQHDEVEDCARCDDKDK